ncbi:hypothetical protein V1525DRAFT_379735 [Lipomyces kononenkoae]|uniref:Uncharacterized protein n=1 Tax=Lipomyces kononenkoae TaxID=34357 RepID=A0ACC3SX71_LIPKO
MKIRKLVTISPAMNIVGGLAYKTPLRRSHLVRRWYHAGRQTLYAAKDVGGGFQVEFGNFKFSPAKQPEKTDVQKKKPLASEHTGIRVNAVPRQQVVVVRETFEKARGHLTDPYKQRDRAKSQKHNGKNSLKDEQKHSSKNSLKDEKRPKGKYANNSKNSLKDEKRPKGKYVNAVDEASGRHSRRLASELDDDDFDDAADELDELDELDGLFGDLGGQRERSRRSQKSKRKKKDPYRFRIDTPALPIPAFITVTNLASLLGVRQQLLVRSLRKMGFDNTDFNHVLDYEVASLIAMEYGFEPETVSDGEDLVAQPPPTDKDTLPPRPPFVTIMGHVDHGKTTILDYLRKSRVAATEHGGITQHIGAFSVPLSNGQRITFLDTPGHAAFLKMRQRGANITDIVVLVVAADDSVMPQTEEAIKHANNSNVPIIVAINKVDKPNINIERVMQDLATKAVYVEGYGGDTMAVPVSGLTGQGIPDLEEAILTLSEILDLRANPKGNAEGWIIESQPKKGRGNTATLVIRRGTLKPGSYLVAGTGYARVRSLRDEYGNSIDQAEPGQPVEVDGWKSLPEAGDEVLQANSEQHAKDVVEQRLKKLELKQASKDIEVINEKRRVDRIEREDKPGQSRRSFRAAKAATPQLIDSVHHDDGPKVRNYVLKADVSGSVEAVRDAIKDIGNDEVKCSVVHSDVGPPTESDVLLAEVSNADILCFNVDPDRDLLATATKHNVKIVSHTIIYHLVQDVTKSVSELLDPIIETKVNGEAEIRAIFTFTVKKSVTKIAGCRISNGTAKRGSTVRVLRNKNVIFDGMLDSLKQGQHDATELAKGNECGMTFKGFDGFEEGDVVQFYEEVALPRYL